MGRFARGVDSGVRLGPGIPDQHLDGPPVDFPTGPISALEELPRRPGRYRVLVSGTAVCVLNAEAIGDLSIRIGTVWEEPLAGRARDRAAALACFDAAAGALGRRARSRTELRRYLLQRQHAAEHAEAALGRLEALGALDDATYARAFVAARAGRSQSRMRLAAELSRRGVARPVADAALAAVYAEEAIDDRASAARLAERKWHALRAQPPEVRRRRLIGFLQRRGYDGGTIREIVGALARSSR